MRIEDYALIGDCQTAALVGRNGSIDWLCWPRFDSPACFAALLGGPENGHWSIAPASRSPAVRRSYRGDTLILETEFETDEGAATLIDFMPVRNGRSSLVRIVAGRRGRMTMEMKLVLRFELPPFLKKDLPRLADFLALLPEGHGAAFEFRNDTWFADDVYDALKRAGASLCLSEREDNAPPPLVETAPWGYVRLRLETYAEHDLERWAQRLSASGWTQVYVYFMHEPTAPAYAQTLMKYVPA